MIHYIITPTLWNVLWFIILNPYSMEYTMIHHIETVIVLNILWFIILKPL